MGHLFDRFMVLLYEDLKGLFLNGGLFPIFERRLTLSPHFRVTNASWLARDLLESTLSSQARDVGSYIGCKSFI